MSAATKKESRRSRTLRWALNLWPCISGSGSTVEFLAGDFRYLRVRVPLSWRTRNRVGTIFGGSMYSATDPYFMLMLMEILGREYVVWDKAASIRFRRPGKETLYVEFDISDARLEEVVGAVKEKGEADFVWRVELKDRAGVVHAEVDKTVYVATKEFYKDKITAARR
jgi:acyl-coenzyme A thioesterase PaaI-like protein